MSLSQIVIQIARLPLPVVAGAYNQFHPNPQTGITKTDASRWLAEAVDAGTLSLDNIMQATPSTFKAAPTIDPAIGAKVDAASKVASDARADALAALNRIDAIDDNISD